MCALRSLRRAREGRGERRVGEGRKGEGKGKGCIMTIGGWTPLQPTTMISHITSLQNDMILTTKFAVSDPTLCSLLPPTEHDLSLDTDSQFRARLKIALFCRA